MGLWLPILRKRFGGRNSSALQVAFKLACDLQQYSLIVGGFVQFWHWSCISCNWPKFVFLLGTETVVCFCGLQVFSDQSISSQKLMLVPINCRLRQLQTESVVMH